MIRPLAAAFVAAVVLLPVAGCNVPTGPAYSESPYSGPYWDPANPSCGATGTCTVTNPPHYRWCSQC